MDFLPEIKTRQLKAMLKVIKDTHSMPEVSAWLDSLGDYHDMRISYRSGRQTKEALLNRAKALITNEQEGGSGKDTNEAVDALRASQCVNLNGVYPSGVTNGDYGMASAPLKLADLKQSVETKLRG